MKMLCQNLQGITKSITQRKLYGFKMYINEQEILNKTEIRKDNKRRKKKLVKIKR